MAALDAESEFGPETELSQMSFREVVQRYDGLSLEDLLQLAHSRWNRLREQIRGNGLTDVSLCSLSRIAKVKWPDTRQKDTPGQFLDCGTPEEICRWRGMGRKKTTSALTLLLALGDKVPEELTSVEAPAVAEATLVSIVDAVERNWAAITADLLNSRHAQHQIGELAMSWGLPWGSGFSLTLGGVLDAPSLRGFVADHRGFGENKLRRLASIIWHAWAEFADGATNGGQSTLDKAVTQALQKLSSDATSEEKILHTFAISGLAHREKTILVRRYGFAGSKAMTLEEIGESEDLTRERVRQLEAMSTRKLKKHALAGEILRRCLEDERADIFEGLRQFAGSSLVPRDLEWKRALTPAQLFLVEAFYETPPLLLNHAAQSGRIAATALGWWLGEKLPEGAERVAEEVRELLNQAQRPLPIGILLDNLKLSFAELERILEAHQIYVAGGFVFPRRPSAAERRCLYMIELAIKHRRSLWQLRQLYEYVMEREPDTFFSQRLLMRDISAIPGAAIDIPGPFLVFNPAALASTLAILHLEEGEQSRLRVRSLRQTEGFSSTAAAGSLVEHVAGLLSGMRILRYEAIEELYCRSSGNSVSSLGPTLLSNPEFRRYCPGYWGIDGLTLEASDIATLCNERDLRRYVHARKYGGLIDVFPFWNAEMEYSWARWAEHNAKEALFTSLLDVAEPKNWPVSEPLRMQWLSKKERFGFFAIRPHPFTLEAGLVRFVHIYGLVHLAIDRGCIGTASIPHFFGFSFGDAAHKAIGTIALLAAMGVLEPEVSMDSPWKCGSQVHKWMESMSKLHLDSPYDVEQKWTLLLQEFIDDLEPSHDFGLFTGAEIKEAVAAWQRVSPMQA